MKQDCRLVTKEQENCVDFNTIPQGDVPGEKVVIKEELVTKAKILFDEIMKQLPSYLSVNAYQRVVLTVCGGSGVGKTSIAALLAYFFQQTNLGCYTLSGDNYPHRLPKYNDAERRRIFREAGIRGMIETGGYTPEHFALLQKWQKMDDDANPKHLKEAAWFGAYLNAGRKGLEGYLGTEEEIAFGEVEAIVAAFKNGAEEIWLKRMGREEAQTWYEKVDFRETHILLIEWTHGNSDYYQGVDFPILLNSTPKETLAYRRARNRDGAAGSAFTTMVLEIEQELLRKQAHKAKLILSKEGELLSYETYCRLMEECMGQDKVVDNGPMLNAYPDSMGGTLGDIISLLQKPVLQDTFQSFYLLPSIYHSDLDRGFSVIDYGLNEQFAEQKDLDNLKKLGLNLKLDFILNHASVLSSQFQDIIKNGEQSAYKDFFIDWNRFWEGCGEMTEEGYILPEKNLIKDMFFRKPGLPILMVRFPDGKEVPYWNTFYQEVKYRYVDEQELMEHMEIQYGTALELTSLINKSLDEGKKPDEIVFGKYEKYKDAVIWLLESNRRYLGQMDLNIKSPLVWNYYENTLKTLADYGAKIIRLDAFAYAPKEPGEKNFLNNPGTWELLSRVQTLADQYNLILLPEIHASYEEKIYELLARKGYMTYDFFLPGLIIDALERKSGDVLIDWARELVEKKIKTVNMLGCHDGIPLLDLKGLISEERILDLIDIIVSRGGFVKNLHGQQNVYYQVNATYYSALGEDDGKMLMARALQLFMPGKPQVWYLDLFVGKNDYEAVEKAGAGGHKEINRTNLKVEQILEKMQLAVVQKQISMLRFRNTFPAFGFEADFHIKQNNEQVNEQDNKHGNKHDYARENEILEISWENRGYRAVLTANLQDGTFLIQGIGENGVVIYQLEN